jgi:hypothetical protein
MAFLQALSFQQHDLPFVVIVEKGRSTDSAVNWSSLRNTQVVELLHDVHSPFEFERYAYELSPFDVTIKTDADLILPPGWTGLPQWSLNLDLVSGVPVSIQGLTIPSSPYRRAWSVHGLPEVHSAFFLFTKSDQASIFFRRVGERFDNFYSTSAREIALPSTDLIYSLAWVDAVGMDLGPGLPFLHMKYGTSGLDSYRDDWVSHVNFMEDSMGTYINGTQLVHPVHYYDKSFPTRKEIACLFG